jgi:hypothetical protein
MTTMAMEAEETTVERGSVCFFNNDEPNEDHD